MMNKEEWLKLRKDEIEKYILASAQESYEDALKLVGDLLPVSLDKEKSNAKKYFNEDLKYEPFCNLEKVNGIDVSSYLNKIRSNEYENELVLFIKDNKVIKEIIIKGNIEYCGKFDENILKEAADLGADIYHAHNHPCRYAAVPSGGYRKRKDENDKVYYQETGDYTFFKTYLPELARKYNVKILDMGIVTEVDYYSVNQAGLYIKHDERQ